MLREKKDFPSKHSISIPPFKSYSSASPVFSPVKTPHNLSLSRMSLSCLYPANSSCSDGIFTMLAVVKRTARREEAGMEQGRVLSGGHGGQWVTRGHGCWRARLRSTCGEWGPSSVRGCCASWQARWDIMLCCQEGGQQIPQRWGSAE